MAIEGKVATILNERELTINQGGDSGVTEGMKFKVGELPTQILDPDTKTPLGVLSREKVRVKISEVSPKFSIGRTYETYQTPSLFPTLQSIAARPVTKVRTLRTRNSSISELGQAPVSVDIGDIVVEVEEESSVGD